MRLVDDSVVPTQWPKLAELLRLIMQAAQYVVCRPGNVVLHKGFVQASGLIKGFLVKAFIKEAACISKHLRFNDQNVVNGGVNNFHACPLFVGLISLSPMLAALASIAATMLNSICAAPLASRSVCKNNFGSSIYSCTDRFRSFRQDGPVARRNG